MGAPQTSHETSSVAPASSPTKNEESTHLVFGRLSNGEIEIAARSSYRYLMSTRDGTASNETRDQHAKAMVEKYMRVEQKLHGNKSREDWENAALEKLKKTLAFRVENKVDDIRLCFHKDYLPSNSNDKEQKMEHDEELFSNLREGIAKRFSNGASIVRGYTKDGLALFQNFPRADTSWDENFYIKGNIYTLERALASTERRTDGEKDKVVVMYDYNGYKMKNSPPIMLVNKLLTILQDHWPERLEHVFVVDAPFIFRAFWTLIKHFIDPITKELVSYSFYRVV